MSKILSQAEIDTLLSVAADVDAPPRRHAPLEGPVERYNFRRPDRISKEQIHALHFLHERFARNISTAFSAYLRTTINMSVVSVEQYSYGEFLSSLPDPTAYYSFAIAPSNELGSIEINPSTAFAMLERLLGGTGSKTSLTRSLTEIEQNVIDSMVRLLLDGLAEAWKSVANLTFSVRGRETRPQMLQVAAANEFVVAVAFQVKVGDVDGRLHVAIPTSAVETAGAHFAKAWQRQRRELTSTERAWLHENLGHIPVPIVPLIRTQLNAGAVLALEPGEVLSLPVAADRALDVFAGGTRKLTGRLASEHGRLMVLVEDRCEPPRHTMEGKA